MSAVTPFTSRVRRFTFKKALSAMFRGVPLRVVDLSEAGARVSHREPLVVGLEGPLCVEIPGSDDALTLRARVVWSRAQDDGMLDTGLKIIDARPDRAADLLDHLVRLGWAGTSKPREARNKLRGSDEDLRSARQALDFLRNNRSASVRWKRLVERDLVASNGYPVEILAAWELLGRAVDVEVVERAQREAEPFVLNAETLLIDDEETAFALVEA